MEGCRRGKMPEIEKLEGTLKERKGRGRTWKYMENGNFGERKERGKMEEKSKTWKQRNEGNK